MGIHVADEACAYLVIDFHQHFAIMFGIHQPPDLEALFRRQGFQQHGDLTGLQGIDQQANRFRASTGQRLGQALAQAVGFDRRVGFSHAEILK